MHDLHDEFELTVCEVDLSLTPAWALEFVKAEGNSPERVLLVTWLPLQLIMAIGLPEQCVCGLLADGREKIAHDNFRAHPTFVEFLHSICVDVLDPALLEYAARCPETAIALIDERTSDVNGAVPSEDILGVYHVDNGTIDRYSPNPNYRLFTSAGSFKLTSWLRQRLVKMVHEAVNKSGPDPSSN